MSLKYKSDAGNNVLEYFANNIVEHSQDINDDNIDDNINSISDAINCLHHGVNPLKSCKIIKKELKNAENQNISYQLLFDTGLIRYILPYININTDMDLLNDAIDIIDKLTLVNQPLDSPLQNEIFLQNMISIFQLQQKMKLKNKVLNIISNLLHDENIQENIFLLLKKYELLKVLQKYDYFNSNYTRKISEQIDISNPLFYSSVLLSDFAQMYQEEELITMIEFIPLLSQGLIDNMCDSLCRNNYSEALSYILKNPNTHPMAIEYKVPENCIKSLCLYHDQSVSNIFDCVFNLIISNDIPEFLSPKFVRLCTHLLETQIKIEFEAPVLSMTQDDVIMHVLRFLEFYLPKYFLIIDSSTFVAILLDMVLYVDKSFLLRINASLILIKCIPIGNDNYINTLVQKHFFTFVFNNISSYDNDDIIFIINIISAICNKKPKIKSYFLNDSDFQLMLDELYENDDDEISQLPNIFIQPEN